MRVTEVLQRGGETEAESYETDIRPLEVDGKVLPEVDLWQKLKAPWGRLEVVQLGPGAELGLHGGEHFAFCQVMSGKGTLELPDDQRSVRFSGPQLFIFAPGTQHGWRDIEETTLMTICVVGAEE